MKRGQANRHSAECRRDRSCRRTRKSEIQAPPSLCDPAFSEESGSYQAFPGSSPITFASIIVKNTPEVRALPSTGIARPQHPARLSLRTAAPRTTLTPLPSLATGLPRLPTRITFPARRAHYPGGPRGCARRFLPRSYCLPLISGGSASASSLSGPAQASHSLRPAGSLNRQRRPLSRGSGPAGYPAKPLVSYQTYRQLSGWNLPPLVLRAVGAH